MATSAPAPTTWVAFGTVAVGGSYVGNIAKIPGVQAQQNFTPTVWVTNLGISHPVVF